MKSRILVVEDNDKNRKIARLFLEDRYELIEAIDGEQGVEKAVAELPELILMDLSLPGIDGWEATRRIKADDRTKHIPIIALTAHAMSGDRDSALAAGCDEFATKPVDFAKLVETIESFLQKAETTA